MLRRTMPLAATLSVLVTAVSLTGAVRAAKPGPAVVELFTSQGCSSCPPADALLETLAREPDIIAVSLPVDYWDYLGWKDTFAKPQFSQRQRAYAIGRGDRQVYTPQAVINGQIHANGSSRGEIADAIAETSGSLSVPIALTRTGAGVAVSVGASQAGSGTIIALPYLNRREVAIGRGENAHTRVVYTNVAREIVPLGTWSGSKVELSVPASALADADGVVVLLQAATSGNPGPVLAAARIALN